MKRRLDDDGFVNVLKQKHKEDVVAKQEIAQNTFALLMRAQQQQTPDSSSGSNTPATPTTPTPVTASVMRNQPSLLSYGFYNNRSGSIQQQQQQAPTIAHNCCTRCSNPSLHCNCSYCEKPFCQNCLQKCDACDNLFCTTCLLIDYSQSVERAFCSPCIYR